MRQSKRWVVLMMILCAVGAFSDQAGKRAPSAVAQALVDAYNAHDIEGILRTYDANSVARRLPGGEVILTGHADIRKKFEASFQRSPDARVEVVQRIVDGDFVIDREKITGTAEGKAYERYGTVIYEIRDGRIVNEWYPRSRPASN